MLFGYTGDVACDHYHRFAGDAALVRELGVKNYRFSIAWPRLLPEGTVNTKGIDFCNRLIDALLGRYPEDGLSRYWRLLPKGWERDMALIHQPLDFYAQNIYHGNVIRACDNAAGYEHVPLPAGHHRPAIHWPITPDALYWGPKFLYERYKTPFLITENGMSCHDAVSLDGGVHDPNREDYMHRYLLAYRRAAEDGVDARGYFAWSLMDNFEWACGYTERFGLVCVDYATQQRIAKDSALWYRRVMESNGGCL